MEGPSQQYKIPLLIATLVMGVLIILVGYVYLSPTGWKAREEAALNQIDQGEFTLYTTLEGVPTEIVNYEGEILIVNIWASWSPYTKNDHEVLEKIKEQYGDRITIRALNRKESRETAIAYLTTIGQKSGIEYIIDTTDHFYTSLDGYAMPETIIFDAIGNVLLHKRGTLDITEMKAQIDDLLNETINIAK
jgi:thiol-disulfide isomerase/thioredoxin